MKRQGIRGVHLASSLPCLLMIIYVDVQSLLEIPECKLNEKIAEVAKHQVVRESCVLVVLVRYSIADVVAEDIPFGCG